MAYIYTETNRLEQPHNYMYAKFEGVALLNSYRDVRLSMMSEIRNLDNDINLADAFCTGQIIPFLSKSYSNVSVKKEAMFSELLNYQSNIELTNEQKQIQNNNLQSAAKKLTDLDMMESISTTTVLKSLIAAQITSYEDEILIKAWLDRVVQRFEVTKKLYERYQPGFRKGDGVNNAIVVYWLFALNLTLYYGQSQSNKYLSTLLKVCDLLLSLPKNTMLSQISATSMMAILSTELLAIDSLDKQGGEV